MICRIMAQRAEEARRDMQGKVMVAKAVQDDGGEVTEDGTFQRYEMRTLDGGAIVGECTTNDPEDRGRPHGFDSWPVRCKTREEFDRRVGRSRVGINGCEVTVMLDGVKL